MIVPVFRTDFVREVLGFFDDPGSKNPGPGGPGGASNSSPTLVALFISLRSSKACSSLQDPICICLEHSIVHISKHLYDDDLVSSSLSHLLSLLVMLM